MGYEIKLHIKKKNELNQYNKKEEILLPLWIKTEAQLCYYMYRRWGVGRYHILAWQKGYEGFWTYWLGDLYTNGFIRDRKENRELNKIENKMQRAEDFQERQELEEEYNQEREIVELERNVRRRGPRGIKKSMPGILHPYQAF